MIQYVSRLFKGIGLCLLILGVSDCAKRVPVAEGTFEAQQNVVLTFKDGRTLQGRMGPGNKVEYKDQGNVYRGQIVTVGEEDLEIGNLILVNREGSQTAALERLARARKIITDPLPNVTLSRKQLEKVEVLKLDTGKSLRRTTFWAYGGALLILLLGERS